MSLGLIGTKIGMSRIFFDNGKLIPITVVKIDDNLRITQIKIKDVNDVYNAIQLTSGTKKSKNISKPLKGHFNKGQKLDACSFSKGKGFSGVIKRHNFSSQRASHGNSLSHNAPGSIGQCQDPGRVFKGKKMAGRMGNKKVTIKNLEIMDIDKEKNLMLIKGSIPGYNGIKIILKLSNINK